VKKVAAGTTLAPIQSYATGCGGFSGTSSLKHGIRDGVTVNLEHRSQHMDQENLCYRANTCRQANDGQNTLGNDNSVTGFTDQSENLQAAAAPGNKEIDKAKQSPSFEREYNLKYLGLIGNVYHTADIERAIQLSSMVGLDPGFGSSAFGVVITEWVDNEIRILHAEEYERPEFSDMINTTMRLVNQFGIRPQDYSCRIYVDGANPEFIRSLKHQLGERPDYEDEIKFYQSNSPGIDWTQNMTVIPVHFVKEHRRMLADAKKIIAYNQGTIAINPRFDKLITSLRTAVEKGEGSLDKDATSHDDILDAFRLALQFYY